MTPAARNTWIGRVLVEELARLDTPLVCLAPGARCAPLSMALGATDRLPWTTFVDERAAAFHALGVGRATGRPAAVITTSGTAVGNLVPAAMEADQAGVPLLLITADRPAELRQTGANQTVQQADILAPLVRHRVDLPCSDPALPFRSVLSTLDQAVHAAVTQGGPVHLNLQFREPLGPADADVPEAIASWFTDDARRPWTHVSRSTPRLPATDQERLARALRSERGLVVVGSLPAGASEAVAAIVETLGWPTYASPDSGVHGGLGLDSALSDPQLARRLAPDTVLWLGGGVVSKRLVGWLREQPDSLRLISVTERGHRIDPAFRVRERLVTDYAALLDGLAPGCASPAWRTLYQQLEDAANQVIDAARATWTELAAARAVLEASSSVFVGASLPIRLADWMGSGDHRVRIGANRGASGIDGVIATATGWSRDLEGARKVLLGDLTCLHDQGSLARVRGSGLQVVVFNNRGGSIFGMLPFGQVQGFETVFRNTHEQSLAPLAQAHGLRTATARDLPTLRAALDDRAVDFVEAWFEHDATIEALAGFHRAICDTLHATWSQG